MLAKINKSGGISSPGLSYLLKRALFFCRSFRFNDIQQFDFEDQGFVWSDRIITSLTVCLIARDIDFPI